MRKQRFFVGKKFKQMKHRDEIHLKWGILTSGAAYGGDPHQVLRYVFCTNVLLKPKSANCGGRGENSKETEEQIKT